MNGWLAVGAINAALSVAAGAFGAHGLKERLTPEHLAVFETAARYHMYHALGLCVIALALHAGVQATAAGYAMLIGIVLFSGSLYALALTGVRVLGAITPLGGVGFLVGWGLLAWAVLRSRA